MIWIQKFNDLDLHFIHSDTSTILLKIFAQNMLINKQIFTKMCNVENNVLQTIVLKFYHMEVMVEYLHFSSEMQANP